MTRHPAQFERLDFTAQILQSASRARKAFYECGWAEAKVLIRPSDGKFERTPFFDMIIRRGLRTSTRFDAATLTEQEIEALGMHRDETLGFKLQIRHFRSNRKELPPQGRARKNPAAEAAAANNARIAARVPNRPLPSNPGPPSGGGARGGGRDIGANRTPPYAMEQQPLGLEAARSTGEAGWADDARWHRGVKGNGGPAMDNGGGSGERWAAWEANRWNDPNAPAGDRDPHRYGGHNTPPPHPAQHAQAPMVPGLAQGAAAHRSGWDGPPAGRVWGDVERRAGSAWHAAAGAADGRGEGFERMVPNGVRDGEGGALGGGFVGGRREQQSEADVRAGGGNGYFHQPPMEQQQHARVPPGGGGRVVNGTPPGFMRGAVGIDGPARGGSPDSSSPGAPGAGGNGSLLHQGYRRLAAMADERAAAARDGGGGGGGQLDTVLTQAQHQQHSPARPPLPHQYEGPAETDLKRSAASVMSNGRGAPSVGGSGRGEPGLGHGHVHGQFSSRPLFTPSGSEDGPAKKKRRASMDGGERANNGGLPQQQQQVRVRARARVCVCVFVGAWQIVL